MFIPKGDNTIGRSLFHYGEWTHSELAVIGQLIRPGMVVADVGANIGTHALAMSKMVGPKGAVVAIEPQPFTFRILSANLLTNGCQNVLAMNAGVSDTEGWIDMPELNYGASGNFGALSIEGRSADLAGVKARIPVPQLRLDDVPALSNVALIKIDVEGMEKSVLAGASQIIKKNRPVLYVENEYPGEKSEALINYIVGLGYEIYWDIAPLFTEKNHLGNKNNVFSNIICINMLCVPAELDYTIKDFKKLKEPSEHPRAKS